MSATVGLEVYLLAVTWSVVVPELTLSVVRAMIPGLVFIQQAELSQFKISPHCKTMSATNVLLYLCTPY